MPWAILAAIVAVVVVVAAVAFVAGRGTSDQPSVASAPTDPTEPGDADQADVELSDPDQPDPDGEGRSTGQTTHPATAEEAALGLERRSALGTTILVPRGWTLSGDPSGTTGRVMFEDPHSPAMLVVDISDCSVCVSAGDEPYPMGAVPADADPTVPDGADVVLYQRPAPSGYETHGVVRVDTDRSGWVEGSTTMEVTVPSSERRLATEILNFT